MTTATELLRRAEECLRHAEYPNDYREEESDELRDDIRLYLAAEKEAEYDLSEVIPLTHRKAKGIIKDRGYNVTGFVLTREDGDKCIVDMSAVRWLTGKEFFEMMHPPVVSPTAETARKPMSEDEIDEEIATNEHYCERSFAEGVRFAERYHGIGGDDE